MITFENFIWYNPHKDASEAEIRKKALDKAKELYDVSEDFRSEAFKYFLLVDFKSYNSESQGVEKDQSDENLMLSNPYLTFNITASCVETVSNKIAKARPKVTFLTKNADRENREIARKLDHWMLKTFKKGKVWKESNQAFKSACISGLGVVKVYIKKNRVKVKKIPLFDFLCDNAHKGDTSPVTAGEKKAMVLADLIEIFPEKKKELLEAHGDKIDKSVMVYELYRQYKKHLIFTEKVTLTDENWEKPLPYIIHKFEPADQGVLSVGVGKKLYAIQSVISYILGKTLVSIKNFAVSRVFLPKGSEPVESEITNIVGQIIEVNSQDGKVPQFSTPPATNPQVLDILNMLWVRGFEVVGISQLSAGGAIPRGLEKASGTALRNYQQVESERFQLIRDAYDESFIKLAKLIIKLVPDNMLPDKMSRAEIMKAKDNMSIWTSSLLPDTPAGKLAMVGDLFNTGLVGGDEALDLLDSPDVKKYISSKTARMKAIDLLLDRALEANKKPPYFAPLGLDMYLDRARKLFAEIIVEEGEESKKLPLLSSCIQELEAKVAKQTQISTALNQLAPGAQQQPQTNEPPAFGQREQQPY